MAAEQERYMEEALALAREAVAAGEVPSESQGASSNACWCIAQTLNAFLVSGL